MPAVKSRSQALRSARPHTFAAPASTLAAIHVGKPGDAVLLLPSLRSAPLDSPELIRITPRPAARSDAVLLPWRVPVVELEPAAALAALAEPDPGVRYGASFRYLADVAALARDLVSRGRVLPAARRDQAGAVASWQVWAGDGSLSRWLSRPQELLLAELGRACRVYPGLAEGLRQPEPCALPLGADDAYHFLAEAAPALDEAGFGVLLPSWWDRRRRLGLTASAYTPVDGVVEKTSRFGRDHLHHFEELIGAEYESVPAMSGARDLLKRISAAWAVVTSGNQALVERAFRDWTCRCPTSASTVPTCRRASPTRPATG